MNLAGLQRAQGAVFAPDGIPLHFGAQQETWRAAQQQAVLLDRSHEARLRLSGSSALDLLQRISTNDVSAPGLHEGCATIFTTWHGRVLDRVELWRESESLLLLGGPGRAAPLRDYLQRNVFFNDDLQIHDLAPHFVLFDLIGPAAHELLALDGVGDARPGLWRSRIAGHELLVAERKPPGVSRVSLLLPEEAAVPVWHTLCAGTARPAGSLLFNALRVRAGLPAAGSELSEDYIPLELGLWDEVSFSKGCYTGQEIIARMESRGQLARMLVQLRPECDVEAPADLLLGGRVVGRLTSCAAAPDGSRHALGVLRRSHAGDGALLQTSQGIEVRVLKAAGIQPFQGPDQSGAG